MEHRSRDEATADETGRAAAGTIEVGLFDWVRHGRAAWSTSTERRLRMVEYADRAG